jgi:outer membrane lipoprotein LolB
LWLLPGLMLLLSSACATRQPAEPVETIPGDAWEMRREVIARQLNWQMDGRVAVNVASEGWSANLVWAQRAERFEMDLHGPFGQGRIIILGGPVGVTVRTSEGEIFQGSDAEELLREHFAMELPVHGLSYWVRGIPDPDRPVDHMRLDSLGRLAEIQQNGWRVVYSAYREGEGVDLPRKMKLEREDVGVRLVVDQWRSPR